MKKKFVIDVTKWRCGDSSHDKMNRLGGFGLTQLLDNNGKMCCLGQVAKQCGASRDSIHRIGTPSDIINVCDAKYDDFRAIIIKHHGEVENTKLAERAIVINDDDYTTVKEKMCLLKKLFNQKGYDLEFINTDKRVATR